MTSAAKANIMLDSPAGCFVNCECVSLRDWVKERRIAHSLAPQEGVEDEASVGQLVARQRVGLLDAPRVGRTRLSQVGIGWVVVGAVRCAPGVLVPYERLWGVGQVVVDCDISSVRVPPCKNKDNTDGVPLWLAGASRQGCPRSDWRDRPGRARARRWSVRKRRVAMQSSAYQHLTVVDSVRMPEQINDARLQRLHERGHCTMDGEDRLPRWTYHTWPLPS